MLSSVQQREKGSRDSRSLLQKNMRGPWKNCLSSHHQFITGGLQISIERVRSSSTEHVPNKCRNDLMKQVDPSQLRSLAIIWSMVLTFGVAFSVGIPACTVNKACHDAVHSHLKSHGGTHTSTNGVLVVVLAFVIGVPVVSTAGKSLRRLCHYLSWLSNLQLLREW